MKHIVHGFLSVLIILGPSLAVLAVKMGGM